MENRLVNNPYQWFFLPGILLGMLGVGLWVAFALDKINFYPAMIHADIMMDGFVLIVAIGFLMTAIPRFTNTPTASFVEKLLPALATGGLFLFSLTKTRLPYHIIVIVIDVLMIRFMLVRIIKCKLTPPASFILVAFGLFSTLLGNILLCFTVSGPLFNLARLLVNYGLSLGLVLGVGSQLVPALLGTKKTVLTQIQLQSQKIRQDTWKLYFFLSFALILLGSFIAEAHGFFTAGRLVRALIISALLLHQWRIYLLPKNRGIFSWCLWISAWMLLLGAWPSIFYPAYAVHAAHLFFIGSFSIMIFTIATRVTLAHGNHDMSPEKKSWALLAMLICMLIALLTRLAAPLTQHNFGHLSYAATFWILSAIFWCSQFVKKLYSKKP